MNPLLERQYLVNRRQFFSKSSTGIGVAALASLLGQESQADGAELPAAIKRVAPKAKRVILLFQNGGPSHLELFDHKPELKKRHGQSVPTSYMEGKRFSTMSAAADKRKLLSPIEPYKQYGKSGAWVSDLMPYTGKIADDICFIKSMHTEQVNHAPAINFSSAAINSPDALPPVPG